MACVITYKYARFFRNFFYRFLIRIYNAGEKPRFKIYERKEKKNPYETFEYAFADFLEYHSRILIHN